MLIRWCNGEHKVWGIVRPPSVADEHHRQLHLELIVLKSERTAHANTIKGLHAGLGLQATVDADFPEWLTKLRQWDGDPVPTALSGRLLHEFGKCGRY
jgi:hypothetical protein